MWHLVCPAFDDALPHDFVLTGEDSPVTPKPNSRLGSHVARQGQHFLVEWERDGQGNTYLTCGCGRRFHRDEAKRIDAPRQAIREVKQARRLAGWIIVLSAIGLLATLAISAWAVWR